MLPEGFAWRPFIDGPALYLDSRIVAMLTPIERGYRVSINPDTLRHRTVFMATEAGAMRYVEAWARKWEDEIRGQGRGYTNAMPSPK